MYFDVLAPQLSLAVENGQGIVLDGWPGQAVVIEPTRASIRGGVVLHGNFLADGPHWFLLREELSEICAKARPVAERQLYRRFADEASPATVSAAVEASRRLTNDRSLVFPHEIRIDVDDAVLTFSPLVGSDSISARHWWEKSTARHLDVPFRYERRGAVYEAALRLVPVGAPLGCDWRQRSDLTTLTDAWSLALEAYAELTCAKRRQAQDKGGRRTPNPVPAGGERSTQRDVRSPHRGSVPIPSGFTPLGSTSRFLASYVAGHRRQLNADHTHSDDAAANAARYGIRLGPHETWVEPYTRGIAPETRLHFRWRRTKP